MEIWTPGTPAAGSVTNAMLASPTAGLYKQILRSSGRYTTAGAAGTTYCMLTATSDQTMTVNANGTVPQAMQILYFVVADFSVAGLTPKLFIRAQATNAGTASTHTVTIGLYPLTVSGGNLTPGAVVTGSTAAIANNGANTIGQANSGDFTVPADGPFALGYILSGTPNVNGIVQAQLYVRNV